MRLGEALCMGAADVLEALRPLLLQRGTQTFIRSDNGPECASATFRDRLRRVRIEPIRIHPASPWENGYNKRFNGTLHTELFNADWFAAACQGQIVTNTWLRQYNHIRPHHALGMRPPGPETISEKPEITDPDQGGWTVVLSRGMVPQPKCLKEQSALANLPAGAPTDGAHGSVERKFGRRQSAHDR